MNIKHFMSKYISTLKCNKKNRLHFHQIQLSNVNIITQYQIVNCIFTVATYFIYLW